MRPVRLTAEETVEVYFCGCKQTSTPPYCDGTHMSEAVQNCELGECLWVYLWNSVEQLAAWIML